MMEKGNRVFRRTYTSMYDLDEIEVGLLIEAIDSQIEICAVNKRPVAADSLKELKVELEESGWNGECGFDGMTKPINLNE